MYPSSQSINRLLLSSEIHYKESMTFGQQADASWWSPGSTPSWTFLHLPFPKCSFLCTDWDRRVVLKANCNHLPMLVVMDMSPQEGRSASIDWPLCPSICHSACVSISEISTFLIQLLFACCLPIWPLSWLQTSWLPFLSPHFSGLSVNFNTFGGNLKYLLTNSLGTDDALHNPPQLWKPEYHMTIRNIHNLFITNPP